MAIEIIKIGEVFERNQCLCKYCESTLEYSPKDVIKFTYQDSIIMRGKPPEHKQSYKTDKVANFQCPNCGMETADVFEEDLGYKKEEKVITNNKKIK